MPKFLDKVTMQVADDVNVDLSIRMCAVDIRFEETISGMINYYTFIDYLPLTYELAQKKPTNGTELYQWFSDVRNALGITSLTTFPCHGTVTRYSGSYQGKGVILSVRTYQNNLQLVISSNGDTMGDIASVNVLKTDISTISRFQIVYI